MVTSVFFHVPSFDLNCGQSPTFYSIIFADPLLVKSDGTLGLGGICGIYFNTDLPGILFKNLLRDPNLTALRFLQLPAFALHPSCQYIYASNAVPALLHS